MCCVDFIFLPSALRDIRDIMAVDMNGKTKHKKKNYKISNFFKGLHVEIFFSIS